MKLRNFQPIVPYRSVFGTTTVKIIFLSSYGNTIHDTRILGPLLRTQSVGLRSTQRKPHSISFFSHLFIYVSPFSVDPCCLPVGLERRLYASGFWPRRWLDELSVRQHCYRSAYFHCC